VNRDIVDMEDLQRGVDVIFEQGSLGRDFLFKSSPKTQKQRDINDLVGNISMRVVERFGNNI
jgi:hypothetical protein